MVAGNENDDSGSWIYSSGRDGWRQAGAVGSIRLARPVCGAIKVK